MSRSALSREWKSAAAAALGAAPLLLGAAPTARADTWLFDAQNTEVRFSWDHLGLSRQSGRFLEVNGRLEFTPTDPRSGAVDVTIRSASLATGIKEYDANLKSADFFDAGQYPEITFKSTAVRHIGDNTGEVIGDLTILGVTRPVTLQVAWNFTGEHPLAMVNPTYKGKWVSGFSATTTIQRSDWGLKRGVPLISDEIHVAIEAEFLRQDRPDG
ncbi:MAG TPA: YceI family protein [Hyphomicrobiaceae bacterium]|nr:YceI family protein [Hyphomicrobiaceae bacterium]